MKIDITKLIEILEKLKNYLIKDYDLTSSDFHKIDNSIESITSIKFPIKKFYSFLMSFWLKDSNDIDSSLFYEKMIYYFHRYNQEEENIDLDFITIEKNYEILENDNTLGSNRKNSSNFTIKTLNNFMNIQRNENSISNNEDYLEKKCCKKDFNFGNLDLEKKSFFKISPISKRSKFFSKDYSSDLENCYQQKSVNFEKSGFSKQKKFFLCENERLLLPSDFEKKNENDKFKIEDQKVEKNKKNKPLLKNNFEQKKNLCLNENFFDGNRIEGSVGKKRRLKYLDNNSKEKSSSIFDDDFSISTKSLKKTEKSKKEKTESKKFITKVNSPFPPKKIKKKRKNIIEKKKILNKNIINENMVKKLDINNLPNEYKDFLKNFIEEILTNQISLESLLKIENNNLLKKKINLKNDLSDIYEETEKYSSEEDKEKNFIFGQKKNLDLKKKKIIERRLFSKKNMSLKKVHKKKEKKIFSKNKKKFNVDEEMKFRKKNALSFNHNHKKSFEENLKKIFFYKNFKNSKKSSPKKKLKKNSRKNNFKTSTNNFKKLKNLKTKNNFQKSFEKKIFKKSKDKKNFKKSLEKNSQKRQLLKKSFKIKKQFSTQSINNIKKFKENSSKKHVTKKFSKTDQKKIFYKSNEKNNKFKSRSPLITFNSLSSSRRSFCKKKFFNTERHTNFTNIYQ